MTVNLLLRSLGLFGVLFVAGTAGCLPFYKWNLKKLFASRLWTKIVWWIPIFIGFQLCLFGGTAAVAVIIIPLLLLAIREAWRHKHHLRTVSTIYVVITCVALGHTLWYFPTFSENAVSLLLIVCFCSALSDVCAYFAGNFVGRHYLPAWINNKKTWEGVVGQLVGALAGYELVVLFLGIHESWLLALCVGLASTVGDLANSAAKRQLAIKDWGETIPGHGGVLDRFSSLSLALAVSYWFVLLGHVSFVN